MISGLLSVLDSIPVVIIAKNVPLSTRRYFPVIIEILPDEKGLSGQRCQFFPF